MDNKQDNRYEALYTQLLERGLDMHMNNKKRIRNGIILLLLLPFILGIMLKLTDSDKIVFLIIWVICMFVISSYLITIEYIDDSIQNTLEDVTERETEFDELLIGTEQIEERISERRERIREKIQAQLESRRRNRDDQDDADAADIQDGAEEPQEAGSEGSEEPQEAGSEGSAEPEREGEEE